MKLKTNKTSTKEIRTKVEISAIKRVKPYFFLGRREQKRKKNSHQ
jgi:hypothetical protein